MCVYLRGILAHAYAESNASFMDDICVDTKCVCVYPPPRYAPTDTPCPLQDGKTALDVAENCDAEVKKRKVRAVFFRHAQLLAAQAGTAELAP